MQLFLYFYDLTQKVLSCNDSATVSYKRKNYRIYFWYMSKVEAINIMKNSDLKEKSGSFKKYKKFFLCMSVYIYKMNNNTTYYQ